MLRNKLKIIYEKKSELITIYIFLNYMKLQIIQENHTGKYKDLLVSNISKI